MKGPCVLAQRSAREALIERVEVLRSHVKAAAAHDVDGIHDLRVASRRLRAIIGDASGRFRKRAVKPFRKRVRAITRGLGKARELDVSIGLLEEIKKSAPKEAHAAIARTARYLRKLRGAESKQVDESCARVRAKGFGEELQTLLDADKGSSKCHRKDTRATLRWRHRALSDAYHDWVKSPSDESLHAVRVALKKLRYSCEIAKPLYGHRMEEFIEQVKAAQEVLGDWNDMRVLRDYVMRCAENEKRELAEFAPLEGACHTRAQTDLGKFIELAPAMFDKPGQAAALKVFAKQQQQCCIRRNPKSDIKKV
jgi:CHAD domain-containing protein